jgi:formate dehydrogenase subunit gamma
MQHPIRTGVVCLALMLACAALARAQAPAADLQASAPATSTAVPLTAPEPRPDDSNAERAISQPGNNAPLWRAVRDQGGTSTLPGAEQGTLIQPFADYPGAARTNAGEAWRQVRNRWILPYGGALVFITLLALALFYWRKGPLGHEHGEGGRRIERFTPFERAAHWSNAAAFVVLAVSGVVMAFGKFLLLPLIGSTLFGALTYALKTVHNFVGPLFAVSLVIVLIVFFRDNIANRADFAWLRQAGGMFSNREVPSHRFNAGEKGVYWWGAFFPGLIVVGSGLVLDKLIPGVGDTRGQMQVAHMLHAAAALAMLCVLIGHIYMGTIGMRGAFRAMKTGYVNEGWAREHHELWHDDIRAGKIPAQRSGQALPTGAAATTPVSPARQG